MFLGIDLGTSSVKAVLIDEEGDVRATASSPLDVSHPRPRWSEQDPASWWAATEAAVGEALRAAERAGIGRRRVSGIGLSGQMHGATLLDSADRVLRPAILWNDGRSDIECAELERVPHFRDITGNLAMPGFTAPKLAWVRKHESGVFDRVAKVLLPKDYLRLLMTGDYVTDASDAAGTLWLDVARRQWSDEMLAATGLTRANMPEVREGSQASGRLRRDVAERWGIDAVPVAAGGGDNAAGAVGVGIVRHGQAMLSLGTSGVYFAVSDGFRSRPEQAVHSFCHALPDTWHLMSVMLNAASCLDFTARLTGYADVPSLLADGESAGLREDGPMFLPYLTGERTPHNDAHARGSFTGLGPDTERTDLVNATLEGVGLGLLDGLLAVESTGLVADEITVIGGGSRSAYWTQMLADILGKPLVLRRGGEVGPALGAARLAHLAAEPGATLDQVCPMPGRLAVREPDAARHAYFRETRHPLFRRLYKQLKPIFSDVANGADIRPS
ncbi:xylulokinase [Luteibacter rhizovicinus]|uniref:Xylulose kinase n=1 Tax=Luteibacter rhizovicinus TaxID=242606 RepID=A0A4R3YWX4_9GAMM|nr:xylulokinase [Luteibacter rhizovicinus]TCV95954.1 xylulokinase [Luteibacter rhizovicinus]